MPVGDVQFSLPWSGADIVIVKNGKGSGFYLFQDAAIKYADEECIWSRDGIYTWRQTYKLVCQYGNYFLSLNVSPGDHVGVYLLNRPEFLFTWLGLLSIGNTLEILLLKQSWHNSQVLLPRWLTATWPQMHYFTALASHEQKYSFMIVSKIVRIALRVQNLRSSVI